MRGLRGAHNWSPIIPKNVNLLGNKCEIFLSAAIKLYFHFLLNWIWSWWHFTFRFWTKWNYIWFKIEWKTVTKIISHSMWKEMEIKFSQCESPNVPTGFWATIRGTTVRDTDASRYCGWQIRSPLKPSVNIRIMIRRSLREALNCVHFLPSGVNLAVWNFWVCWNDSFTMIDGLRGVNFNYFVYFFNFN